VSDRLDRPRLEVDLFEPIELGAKRADLLFTFATFGLEARDDVPQRVRLRRQRIKPRLEIADLAPKLGDALLQPCRALFRVAPRARDILDEQQPRGRVGAVWAVRKLRHE